MTRAMMMAAVLSLSLGAFAAEPTKDASAPAAAPAPAEAAKPASAHMGKKSKEECEKEGVKGKKALKKCMHGK